MLQESSGSILQRFLFRFWLKTNRNTPGELWSNSVLTSYQILINNEYTCCYHFLSAELLKLERVRSPSIQSFQSSIHHSPFTIHTIRHPHSSDHHPDITSSIHGILQQAIIESSSKGIIGVRLPSHIPPSAGKPSVPPNT